MRRINPQAVLAAVYAIGFVITFGHAYVTDSKPDPEQRAIGAFLCSMAWPLYVSAELWRSNGVRKERGQG